MRTFRYHRPTDVAEAVRLVAGAGLLVFTAVYLDVFRRAFDRCRRGPVLGRLAVVAGLGVALSLLFLLLFGVVVFVGLFIALVAALCLLHGVHVLRGIGQR